MNEEEDWDETDHHCVDFFVDGVFMLWRDIIWTGD
jgi:hypothetical protein